MELADLWVLARAAPTLWEAISDPTIRTGLNGGGAARAARVQQTLSAALAMRDQTGFSRWVERTWMTLGGPAAIANDAEAMEDAAALEAIA